MSILTRASKPPEQRAAWGDSTPPPPSATMTAAAGVAVNDASVLGLAAAYACTGLIADSLVTLPLRQYRGRIEDFHQAVEIDPAPVVTDPYAEIDQMDWQSQVLMSMLLRGNAYGQVIDRDRRGFASQVMPVHPDRVRLRRLATGEREYKFHDKVVPLHDVVHIKARSMPGSLVGLNPIEYLRVSFALGIAMDAYAASFFRNSSTPGGVIEVDGEMDDTDALRLARSWMKMHQGPGNAYMPAVLTGGAKWHQVTLTPEDSQFIQAKGLTRTDMCGIYRTPPHMIGDTEKSTSWGTGIESQEIGFTRNTLLWWARRLERSKSALLPPGEFVRFDFSERLRGNTVERFGAHRIAREIGLMNADEIRAREGLPPIPGGKGTDYLQPLNYAPVGTVPDPKPAEVNP